MHRILSLFLLLPLLSHCSGELGVDSTAGIELQAKQESAGELKQVAEVIYRQLEEHMPTYFSSYSSTLLQTCADDLISACFTANNCASLDEQGPQEVLNYLMDRVELCLAQQTTLNLQSIAAPEAAEGLLATTPSILVELSKLFPDIDFYSTIEPLLSDAVEHELGLTHQLVAEPASFLLFLLG